MTFTALPQFQDAVIGRLAASEEFMALVPGGIHDAVQKNAVFPYAVLDLPLETPNRTFGQNGHFVSAVLSVYTQDGTLDRAGRGISGYRQAAVIMECACGLLINDDDPIVVEQHDVVAFELDSLVSNREDDGVTRRSEMTFTAELEDNGD